MDLDTLTEALTASEHSESRRLALTALRKVSPMLTVEERANLASFSASHRAVVARLIDSGCDAATAATYVSRVRSTIRRFDPEAAAPGMLAGRKPRKASSSRRMLDAELVEAFAAVAGWPHLGPHLMPILLELARKVREPSRPSDGST
jgi:hypothetical protein